MTKPLRTYILASDFNYEPDGPIQVGRIIANPFGPGFKPVHIPESTPATVSHTEFENSFRQDVSRSNYCGIWAEFLQFASLNLGVNVSKDFHKQFSMETLETIRIKVDPTDEHAQTIAKIPAVRAAMSAGLTGSAPVYMVTGVKIARGFKMSTTEGRTIGAHVGAGVPIIPEIGAGAETGFGRSTNESRNARSETDIVFAYQLHIIGQKKWWRKAISTDVYAPKAAFLHEQDVFQDDDMAVGAATLEQLLDIAEENEYDSVIAKNVSDGGETVACISSAMV